VADEFPNLITIPKVNSRLRSDPTRLTADPLGGWSLTMARNTLVFGVGVLVALLIGWVRFPSVLYVQQLHLLDFLLKTHAEKS
jgi:hypothetical protein